MSFLYCCVPGCSNRAEATPLHRFPHPKKDVERFRSWVMNIGGDIIALDNNYIFKNRRVCHKHFHNKWHYTKNRLCPLAIPTLHLAGSAAIPRVEMEVASTAINRPAALKAGPVAVPTLDLAGSAAIPRVEMEVASTSSNYPRAQSTDCALEVNTAPSARPSQKKSIINSMTKSELKMCQTIQQLRKKILKSKMKYVERLKLAKASIQSLDVLTKKLSKTAACFVNMQISQAGKSKKGRRFTLRQKILALSVYKSSPRTYRQLSQLCILPRRSTLNSLLQKIFLKPGVNMDMYENLKERVGKMPNHHKYCAIIFDEMAIAPHLDVSNEKIIGFVDDGDKREAHLADHVLVFMVRGVIKKYKQPVQFTFCAGSTKTLNLKNMIKNVITHVQKCGLKVVATICDQGATNVAAVNALIRETKETYLRKGEEYPEGEILINGQSIYPLYDPPHLIKGIRNNLLNKNLMFTYKNKKCVAKWDHLLKLYHKSPGSEGVRLAPNLTLHHVMPEAIPKMRVKHCTQVFSSSVAVALAFSADAGILPEEVKETGKALIFFDRLFDSVNGSFSAPRQGKIYRAAVTPTSPHHKLWRESLEVLKTMRYVDKNGKETIVPTLSSWIKTIQGVKMLCHHMFKLKERSLLLRNFNQDPLENFFGAIRAHGHSNIMPTAAAFQSAFKTLLINNMSSAHSVGANCEKDSSNDNCLQNLQYFFTKNYQEQAQSYQHINLNQIDLNVDHLNICVDVDALLQSNSPRDIEKCAAIGYCSGWLIRTAKKYIYKNCNTCTSQLESREKQDFHNFIKMSEYSDKSWLCYPTKKVFDMFVHVESIVMEVLKSNSFEDNLIAYVKVIVATIVNFGFITCTEHKSKVTEYLINRNVLFCINNWCKEVNKILSGKSVNTDERDPVKVAAQNYYLKNKTKKRKRATGVMLSV